MGTRDRDWARATPADDPDTLPPSRLPRWQWVVALVLLVALVGTTILSTL